MALASPSHAPMIQKNGLDWALKKGGKMKITQQELLENNNVNISDHEKFVSFTKWMDAILKEQREQTNKLGSINTI